MKPMLRLLLVASLLAVAACSAEKVEVLKSPCVGLDDSPCGVKRPLNGNYHTQS